MPPCPLAPADCNWPAELFRHAKAAIQTAAALEQAAGLAAAAAGGSVGGAAGALQQARLSPASAMECRLVHDSLAHDSPVRCVGVRAGLG